MTTPEANPADLAEDVSLTRDAARHPEPEVPLEAPEADVLEQATDAGPDEHVAARSLPLEADEADAAEQAVVVENETDEYREH